MRRKHPKLTPEQEKSVIDAYKSGLSRYRISLMFDTHVPAIQKVLVKHGVPLRDDRRRRGSSSPLFKGGRYIGGEGYVVVQMPEDSPYYSMAHRNKGTVLEHRLVMAEHLGRALYPFERVHHKNGDRSDNLIENLELWRESHPPGQRVSDVAGHCPTCRCGLIAA